MENVLWPGMLKIHSGGSSSQQTVLTIPANQLKQLGVGTGSAGLQTIIMPVGKGTYPLILLASSLLPALSCSVLDTSSASDADLCACLVFDELF